jgi:hypothetical protein
VESQKSKSVEGTTDVAPTKESKSATQTLKDSVKEALAKTNGDVKATVIDKMVADEKTKRVGYLEKAFAELTRLEGELKKINPDLSFLAEGGEETKAYSADQLKKRKDVQEHIKKLEEAFGKAVGEKDWSPLKQLVENSPKA